MKESCIALTEPFEAAVVAVAQSAELAMPKRTSLPSMLPPGCSEEARLIQRESGEHRVAALLRPGADVRAGPRKRRSSRPGPPSPVACRRPCGRTCSRARRRSAGSTAVSRKLESGVGFSNGCAELTLKKPPPLVPSCLMAICEAAGPTARVCSVTSLSVGVHGRARPARPWRTERASARHPGETSASARTSDSGSRM